MPPRRQAENQNNQQPGQPNQRADQANQQADQQNQQADQENQDIQKLLDLSANTFSEANAFNQLLARFMINVYDQLKVLTEKVSEMNLQNLQNECS